MARCPSAPAPPGTALSDFARRNPSEIPSQTQSISAFLPGKVSMGTPFLRRITLQGHATPASNSSAKIIEIERRQAAYKSVALTLRHIQWATPMVIALQTSQILRTIDNGDVPVLLPNAALRRAGHEHSRKQCAVPPHLPRRRS